MRVIKKLLSIALASALLLGLVGPVSALAAPTMKDIKGHWAEQYIKDGVAHGYINGYENGTFKPDNPVSRAEFCKMVNNALGVSRSAGISFNDVNTNNWFYEDVRRAVSAGYITGDDRNNFNGDAQIKRRDAAVVISRIQTPPSSLNNMSEMVDVGEIPSYALEGAKAVYAKGYMTGDDNQRYRPDGNLTRAEAAKIIESILATENIVRDSAMLYQSGQSVANTLYVGDVTIPAGTTGTININNCRMLGNLEVAGGDAVNLASTGVNQLNVTNSSDKAEVRATGYSSVKNAVVSRGCSLTESSVSGDGFTNVQLTGTALKGEDVYLTGSFNNVIMNGAANLNLSSGTIAQLNVSANASGSRIYLARNTRVTLADVNANCDFTGSGNISSATVGNHSVTFETQPDYLNGTGGTGVLVPTVTPKNGATDVSLNTKITLSFNETVQDSSGRDLTSSRVSDVVQLRRGSESGSTVAYSASVSGNRTITITPDDNLRKDTEYYIILLNQSLRNNAGQYNSKQVFRFNTGNASGATTNPVDGADTIPVTTDITIKFSEAMHDPTASGTSTLSRSYIEDQLTLRRGSSSGNSVSFNASVSSDRKTITITPRSNLATGTKYYVSLPAGALRNSNRDDSRAVSFSFTTADTDILVPKLDPASGSKDVSRNTDITLTFDTALFTSSGGTNVNKSYLENDVFTLRRDKENGTSVPFTADINSNRKVVTISPDSQLRADTEYYLIMARGSLADGSGSSRDTNIKMTFTFSTGGSSNKTMEPTVSPKENATGVSADTTIKLTFDERIYNTSGNDIKSSYLRDSVIELRRASSNGTKLSFSAEMTNNYTITVTPSSKLDTDTKYYIIVKSGSLQNSSGTRNDEFVSYFTVGTTTGNVISVTVSPSATNNKDIPLSRNGSITINFSEKLYYSNNTALTVKDHLSHIKNNVKLTRTISNENITYTPTLSTDGKKLTIKPDTALLPNEGYTLRLTANAFQGSTSTRKNEALTATFKTNNDQATPTITAQSGTNTAANPDTTIRLNFGEPLYTYEGSEKKTLTDTQAQAAITIRVGDNSDSAPTAAFGAKVDTATGAKSITVTPSEPLKHATDYYVVFTNGTNDSAKKIQSDHNGIYSNFTQKITVRPSLSVTVESMTSNATGNAYATGFKMTFNSELTNLTEDFVKTNFIVKEGGGDPTSPFTPNISLSGGKTIVTFSRSALLKAETIYTVTVEAGLLKNTDKGTNVKIEKPYTAEKPTVTLSAKQTGKDRPPYPIEYTIENNYNSGKYTLTVMNGSETVKTLMDNAFPVDSAKKYVDTSALAAGSYTLNLVYTYDGNQMTKSCSLVVDPPSDDATLEFISISDGKLGHDVKLQKGEYDYTVDGVNPAKITITYAVNGEGASASISENGFTLSSGESKKVTITVTAADGTVQPYTITLNAKTTDT